MRWLAGLPGSQAGLVPGPTRSQKCSRGRATVTAGRSGPGASTHRPAPPGGPPRRNSTKHATRIWLESLAPGMYNDPTLAERWEE